MKRTNNYAEGKFDCFSYVRGHKNAQEIVIDINSMKSRESDSFYIDYSYCIRGSVTENDWDKLNLSSDFMKI